MIYLALALHVLSAVVWVGGMFAAYICLRPATHGMDAHVRFKLWLGFFRLFFPWVWLSVVMLLVSGYWMMLTNFGGFAYAPRYINIMQGLGWIMILLYAYLFHGPWLKFKRAVAGEHWSAAGTHLSRIRQVIMINLPLGLIVVIIGGTGRFWTF